ELIDDNFISSYTIFHKTTLQEARETMDSQAIDVVLIDLTLPDSFGIFNYFELFNTYKDTPFIVLTGIDDDIIGINAVKNGAQDFLVKGNFDGPLLNRSIQYAVERKKTEVSLRQSEKLFKELFYNSIDAIYMTNEEG